MIITPIKLLKLGQFRLQKLSRLGIYIFITAFILVPVFVLAANDVQIANDTNFQLNTFDTSVSTAIVASSGGQATNFDIQLNYIDITLDNLSSVTFTTTAGGQYLKIIHQSGSADYTVAPSCPTTTATLAGTGATAVLRLEVLTTNTCISGALDHFVFNTISNQIVGNAFSITITAQDSGNNTVASYIGTNTLSNTVSDISPTTTGAFIAGVWTGSVIIGTTGTGITISTTGSSKSGVSNSFNVSSAGGIGVYYMPSVNGVCGSANNTLLSSAPITNLCSAGMPSAVTGSGPWTWICNGLFGGLNSTMCNADKFTPPTPPVTPPTPPVTPPTPPVTPPTCVSYMTKYIKFGAKNDPAEVKKLQIFLRDYEGFSNLSITGIYDKITFDAVEKFQKKYTKDILSPWGETVSTGFVYTTTIKKINEIYCKGAISPSQPSGAEYQNTVSTLVQNLLNIADKEQGETGEQVKIIAEEQNDSKDKIVEEIDKVQKRSNIITFLIGTDYKSTGQLKSEMAKTKNHIDQLKLLLGQTTNVDSKKVIQAQIQALEKEQQKIVDFIKANDNKFSLFGWLVKLFVK